MKTFEEKRAELQSAKDKIFEEMESFKVSCESKLLSIDADLEALDRAESLLSESLFSSKGRMSVREGLIRALTEAGRPLHLNELIKALEGLGIHSDRGSIRARIAKSTGKDIERVAEATYTLKKE